MEGIPQGLKPTLILSAFLPRLKPWPTWKQRQDILFASFSDTLGVAPGWYGVGPLALALSMR